MWALLVGSSAFLVQPCVAARDCHEEMNLEEREQMANVVVTGTVKKVMSEDGTDFNIQRDDSPNGGRKNTNNKEGATYKSEIEIKRVFKGDEVVDGVANVYRDPVRLHKMVTVEGFGDPHICASQVHVADTKIFLLTKGYNGQLRLNSSILPITLTNLDYTEAVVKSESAVTGVFFLSLSFSIFLVCRCCRLFVVVCCC